MPVTKVISSREGKKIVLSSKVQTPPTPSSTPTTPAYPTISAVWDVVGADNLRELNIDPAFVVQDKMSMLLYDLFLRNDRGNIAKLLLEFPSPIPPKKVKLPKPIPQKTSSASQYIELVNPSEYKNTTAVNVKAPTANSHPSCAGMSFINDDGTYNMALACYCAGSIAGKFPPPSFSLEGNLNTIFSTNNFNTKMSVIYKRCKPYITSGDCLYSGFCKGIRFNTDYSFDQDRFAAFGIKQSTYSPYKLARAYNIVPISPQSIVRNVNLFYMARDIEDYSFRLSSLFRGFPNRSLTDGRYLQFPILDLPFLRMQFVFRGKKTEESMLIAKYISFSQKPDGRMYPNKMYFPVLFLRDRVLNENYSVFAGLPGKNGKHLPLYNTFGLERIEKAETVVICGTIEDADAMQRYDERNSKCAYTAFVCDPLLQGHKDWSQVDFSPLKGKRVEFLISNHSGRDIKEERNRIHGLYHHLKQLQRPKIKEFCFRERIVEYPSDCLQNLTDYYNAYWKQRSKVVSMKTYSETDFLNLVASPNGELPADIKPEGKDEETSLRELASDIEKSMSHQKTISIAESSKKQSGRPKHSNLTAEKTLLRPFIRRGCTTILTGNPEIEKRGFAISLAAQVAGSKSEFLKDRFWTRCLSSNGMKTGYKVAYWVFDDISQDDIRLQRNCFARGLSSEQDNNLIIEPARSFRKRDCESLKVELEKYTSQEIPHHPIDFLIIDSLVSFAKSPTPAKIFSAFEELIRLKDELPGLAILVLHHNSKDCKPDGILFDMPRAIIEMSRDSNSVLDDIKDPVKISVIKHGNEQSGIDIVPFEIKLDGDQFVVTNNSDWPPEKVQKLVIREYKHNHLEPYSNTDIGRLLGVSRKVIEGIWGDGAEKEAQLLWNDLKGKF